MPMSFGGISKSKVATIIVAADGSGDTTDIQTGINLLPAGGGVVYIKEGNYTITSVISITSDNVSLKGAGKATRVFRDLNTGTLELIGVDFIEIDSIFFESTGPFTLNQSGILISDCNTVKVHGCWFDIGNDNGVRIRAASSDILIDGNSFFGNCEYGVKAEDSNVVIIVNNSFVDIGAIGCYFHTCDYSVTSGNICDGVVSFGIHCWDSGYNIFSNNIIKNCISHGILIDNDSDRNIIDGNVVIGNGGDGINILNNGCNNNLIHGNIAYDNTGTNISDSGTGTVSADNITT